MAKEMYRVNGQPWAPWHNDRAGIVKGTGNDNVRLVPCHTVERSTASGPTMRSRNINGNAL